MIELALDLGTKLGVCIRFSNGEYVTDCVNLKDSSDENKHKIFDRFEKYLEKLHGNLGVSKIYYERVDFAYHSYSAQAHGAFKGVLEVFAEQNSIPIKGIAVSTIKKELTGRGNASKMGMIHYAEKFVGHKISNDNEADAAGVMYAGRSGRK